MVALVPLNYTIRSLTVGSGFVGAGQAGVVYYLLVKVTREG